MAKLHGCGRWIDLQPYPHNILWVKLPSRMFPKNIPKTMISWRIGENLCRVNRSTPIKCNPQCPTTSHRSLSHLFRWEATRRIGCLGMERVEGWNVTRADLTFQLFPLAKSLSPNLVLLLWENFPSTISNAISVKVSWLCRWGWVRRDGRWQYPKRIQKLWYWDVVLHSVDWFLEFSGLVDEFSCL